MAALEQVFQQPFRFAHAAEPAWVDSVESIALQLSATPVPPLPLDAEELGFIYLHSSLHAHAGAIAHALRTVTGVKRWVGTASPGVIAGHAAYEDVPGIAVMLGTFPGGSIRFFSEVSPLPRLDLLDRSTPWWTALVSGHVGRTEARETLRHISALLGSGFLFGGLTGRPGPGRVMPVFTGQESNAAGLLGGVAFRVDSGSRVHVRMATAFQPMGEPHQITETHDNVIMELDGKGAKSVLDSDYLVKPGNRPAELLQALNNAPEMLVDAGVYEPVRVAISQNNRQQMDNLADFELTSLEDVEPLSGALCLKLEEGAELPRTGRVRFCTYDPEHARGELDRVLGLLCEDILREGRNVRGALYISSRHRVPAIFPSLADELFRVRQALPPLGAFPMVGYQSEAELFHDFHHHHAGMVTLFTD